MKEPAPQINRYETHHTPLSRESLGSPPALWRRNGAASAVSVRCWPTTGRNSPTSTVRRGCGPANHVMPRQTQLPGTGRSPPHPLGKGRPGRAALQASFLATRNLASRYQRIGETVDTTHKCAVIAAIRSASFDPIFDGATWRMVQQFIINPAVTAVSQGEVPKQDNLDTVARCDRAALN